MNSQMSAKTYLWKRDESPSMCPLHVVVGSVTDVAIPIRIVDLPALQQLDRHVVHRGGPSRCFATAACYRKKGSNKELRNDERITLVPNMYLALSAIRLSVSGQRTAVNNTATVLPPNVRFTSLLCLPTKNVYCVIQKLFRRGTRMSLHFALI